MNNVSKTLYIPLYGKACVSRKNVILRDSKAEEIWDLVKNEIRLKGKSASKWLAYYMGMRSAVFDNWLKEKMQSTPDAVIVHIGCGLDSRVLRVGTGTHRWYDVDFPEVISERRRWYEETDLYRMIASDARETSWLDLLPGGGNAIVVMEGISMYLRPEELQSLLTSLSQHFDTLDLMADCYTTFAARASKYKNPINDVGVTTVYGTDDPTCLENGTGLRFVSEHEITPEAMVNQLRGSERLIFRKLFAGNIAHKMYRLYEYRKDTSN